MTDQMRVLQGPFDVTTHKATFTNYLEVVITKDGTIVYACPSHNDVMARIAVMMGVHSDECPEAMWLDFDGWLREVTGCVCVWTGGYLGDPNEKQQQALEMLRREGLMCA